MDKRFLELFNSQRNEKFLNNLFNLWGANIDFKEFKMGVKSLIKKEFIKDSGMYNDFISLNEQRLNFERLQVYTMFNLFFNKINQDLKASIIGDNKNDVFLSVFHFDLSLHDCNILHENKFKEGLNSNAVFLNIFDSARVLNSFKY